MNVNSPIHVIHSIVSGLSKKNWAEVSHVGISMNITANGSQQMANVPTIVAIIIVILEREFRFNHKK